jgi:hypothetical protein
MLVTGLALQGYDTPEQIVEFFLPDTEAMIAACQAALRSTDARVRDMAQARIAHLEEVRRHRKSHRRRLLAKIGKILRSDLVQWHLDNKSFPGGYAFIPSKRTIHCRFCGAKLYLAPCPKCFIGEMATAAPAVDRDLDIFEDKDGEPYAVEVYDAQAPTDAVPGSARKIAVMAQRRAQHQRLYHPDDRKLTDRQIT